MNGLSISYYCPVCDRVHNTIIGITPYRNVKGTSMANIRCKECGTELLVKTLEPTAVVDRKETRLNMQIRDYTKDRFTDLIDKEFKSGVYSDKDSEEFIMQDIIKKLEEKTSVVGVSRHILGIKKYIELKMCNYFNYPTTHYNSYIVDTGDEKTNRKYDKYIVRREDTVYEYTVCY